MATLEKIRGKYYTTANGHRCDEWGFQDIVDTALFEAVRKSIYGELEGSSINDLLKGEWNDIKLSEGECKKIADEYKSTVIQCIEGLKAHVAIL